MRRVLLTLLLCLAALPLLAPSAFAFERITVLVSGAQENDALRAIHQCFHMGEEAPTQTVAER